MNNSLLEQFENSGKEVYQVTQNEWVNIMKDHFVNSCKRPEQEFNTYDKIEVKCFHKSKVEGALKNGSIVPETVLKDYPGIMEEVKKEIEREELKQKQYKNIPIFTQEIFNNLNIGDKITVGVQKVTVYKKEKNTLVCKLYRCKKQGIELIVGGRYNIKMGWC